MDARPESAELDADETNENRPQDLARRIASHAFGCFGGLFPLPEGEEAWEEYLKWTYIMWDDEQQKILDQCGEFVIAEWIRQRPGTRPRWWWAKAPGTPRRLDARLDESQAACLKRLGLLTPEEEQRLGPHDFEPDET